MQPENKKPTALDTMTFPLHGARLIEASAGTGKTFTIAGLYLRLLLGHGNDGSQHRQPLTVDQILVVTFTEAATAELRDRIRARIHQARIAFARGESSDPVIQPLLEEVTDHRYATETLLQAERQMDEAAVYTIHGFCQRMLTQNAFESGARFNNEFVTDESRLKAQVAADFWRSQFYPLNLEMASEVRKLWATPSALLSDISRYLTGPAITMQGVEGSVDIAALHQANLDRIKTLKANWLAVSDDVVPCISQSDVNKRSYTKKSLPSWVEGITYWAQQETLDYGLPSALEKFSQSILIEKTPKGEAPSMSVFSEIEAFLATPPELKTPLLAMAIHQCRTRLALAKEQKQWLSFDDLLTQLSAALDLESGDMLAEKIRTQFPVAMIDEFQDTDPLQYQIFSSVYLSHPECGWFMIGDPKQAIYGFRGADIFTYIQARNQVVDHYTLGTNWRSSERMVNSVNTLFDRADSPFLYDSDIPFYPVNASPKAGGRQWQKSGEAQPALQFWLQEAEAPLPKGDYQQHMAAATAQHIKMVLTESQTSDVVLADGDKQHPVEAGDIAVLVRTGSEGQLIKQALAERGIASVYLSNRDSVFGSPVAEDMLRLMQAIWYQDDERLLKGALASELFALPANELDGLNNHENLWEQVVGEFRDYRQLWQLRGVLPMLRSVLFKREMSNRLLSTVGGERLLTDYLHLGELLQAARQDVESDTALLRWFAQSIEDAKQGLGGGDDHIQRLESERNLVQIITIHKSKGLEYDLVYLPFAVSYREAMEAKYYDEQAKQSTLDLRKSKEALAQADKERLAEDLRLIYVALTRAVYACFIGIAPLRNGRSTKEPTGVHHSALGYLVQNGQELGVSELGAMLAELANHSGDIAVIAPPEPDDSRYQAPQAELSELSAKEQTQDIDRDWRLTSYSALVKQSSHGSSDEVFIEESGLDIDSSDDEQLDPLLEPEKTIFHFPKGARPGTFLHTVFEEIEFTEPAGSEGNSQIIAELLEKEQYDPEWLPVLTELVDQVMNTALDGDALFLRDKGIDKRLVEMEFLLPIDVLDAPSLNRVIQRHDSLSAKAHELGFYTVKGMLKGFIDLVFEHQGKYFVLDWKSNYLGDDVSCYQRSQLEHAMVDHRYDLQYQIYALALHRFLKTRIPNYDYDTHVGGVYYLFLRGIEPNSDSGIFSARPTKAMIEALDGLFFGAQPSHNQGMESAESNETDATTDGENQQMGLGF
ncbi:exodeoxyribonuclease V subunit beta [Vibrio sp. SCSIO 43140]|uniref:exodeoxyribonuclease V subunit beta n=1 Tax=Vibrio sp. SCSIO 43140 TaxID=2819100 RepID=UPI0020760C3A|nr:exodeoxyribonuclease V subunit beta [Vibrio sp. SCSIO 43140]USD59762.1 exodeoxyribonuclease V subunit beta [Vibrio sp. SCSIO 43140]